MSHSLGLRSKIISVFTADSSFVLDSVENSNVVLLKLSDFVRIIGHETDSIVADVL